MMKISSCLWFDNQGEDAAKFYTRLFPNSKIGKTARYTDDGAQVSGQKSGDVMTIEFEIAGHKVLGLNGGPHFKFTPAMSFFVRCETEREIDQLWKELSAGGETRMGLDKYPWAPKYGWTTDKYGVNWQLMLSDQKEKDLQKIAPSLLFANNLFGRGQEAIDFYTSIFKDSKIDFMARDESTKTIAHCAFKLLGQDFVLMEGPGTHNFKFSNAFSIVVSCDTQAEIDHYWDKLSAGGSLEQCGWLKDKYGVSWQIVSSLIGDLMTNPKTAKNVMSAVLKMKKIDIEALKQASEL